jgi:hypothetical protein
LRLEDVKPGVFVRGLASKGISKVVGVEWHGDQAITAIYEDDNGTVKNRVVYRANH